MAYVDLYREISGVVPKLPIDAAKKFVQRAWADIRRKNIWSFLLGEANWTSPSITNDGTVTVQQGLNSVQFDSAAIASLNAIGLFPSSITQRQFRVGIGTIYNIWAWDPVGGIATLDRPYAEASGTNVGYAIFQCYYAAPVKDFKGWISIVDIINFNDLVTTMTRQTLNMRDPQRTMFYLPTHCVFYQQDQNPASATYRWPMYELWGQPQYSLTYQLYYFRHGVDFTSDTDALPPAVEDDCVIALAKNYAYEWAEANKADVPRNVGSDYKFLMQKVGADYDRLFREYRKQDRETVDNWISFRRPGWGWANLQGYYNSIGMTANPGAPW